MLELKRNSDSTKLSDQFVGVDTEKYEASAEIWDKCQEEMNSAIESALKEIEGGASFDTTILLEILFKYFNTQELQEILLIQLAVQDVNGRAERHIKMKLLKENFLGKLLGELSGDDEEDEIDDVL